MMNSSHYENPVGNDATSPSRETKKRPYRAPDRFALAHALTEKLEAAGEDDDFFKTSGGN